MKRKVVAWLLVGTLGISVQLVNVQADNRVEVSDLESTESIDPVENDELEEEENSVYSIRLDETNFPDETFRQYVQSSIDTDGDMELSEEEITNTTNLDLNLDENNKNIQDLTGIEYFTEIVDLDCQNTEITTLDLSMNVKLENLNVTGNQLTDLAINQCTELAVLECANNHLSQLDLSGNTMLTAGSYCDQVMEEEGTCKWYYDQEFTQKVEDTEDMSAVAGKVIFLSVEKDDTEVEQEEIQEDSKEQADTSSTGLSNDYEDLQNSKATVSKKTMYRLYNPNSGEHFYTANTAEKNHLKAVG